MKTGSMNYKVSSLYLHIYAHSCMCVSLLMMCTAAHNDGVCAIKFSPGLLCSVLHTTIVCVIGMPLVADGTRLCTCGGDGIVRILHPAAKMEIISKKSSEVLQ